MQAIRVNAWLLRKDPGEFDESYFKTLNTLVHIFIAISTLQRRQALANDGSSNVEKSIEAAILSVKERWKMA